MLLSHGQVETALATLYGADSQARRNSIRGRLKHLARFGIPIGAETPGKGRERSYTREQAIQMLIGMEVGEFGLDPAVAGRALTAQWQKVAFMIKRAGDRDNPVYFGFRPCQMSAGWKSPGDPLAAIPWIMIAQRRDRKGNDNAGLILDRMDEDPPRVCMFNLTSRILAFDEKLAEASSAAHQRRGRTSA